MKKGNAVMKKNMAQCISGLGLPLLLVLSLGTSSASLWAKAAPTASTKATASAEDVAPIYIQVMRQWAKITNFPENAADVIVAKLKMDLEKDPNKHVNMTDDFAIDLKQFFYELFYSEEMMKDLARLYSQYFSLDEMLELNKFYQTPLGQKLVRADSQLREQTQKIGEKLLKSHEKEYMQVVGKHIAPKAFERSQAPKK